MSKWRIFLWIAGVALMPSALSAQLQTFQQSEVVIETPVNLTKRQRELLQEFDRSGDGSTHPESEGFFAKVKELWADLKD